MALAAVLGSSDRTPSQAATVGNRKQQQEAEGAGGVAPISGGGKYPCGGGIELLAHYLPPKIKMP